MRYLLYIPTGNEDLLIIKSKQHPPEEDCIWFYGKPDSELGLPALDPLRLMKE